MAVIQTIGLSKRYRDKWAVDHVSLKVEQGDIYGFIGQNGAGKSTTLKLLCGLARPTEGEALIFDRPIHDPIARRRVGALIERPGLYPDLSGRENLQLYATLLGLDSPAKQTDEILETVGLPAKEKKPVKQYSMGMKQRLISSHILGELSKIASRYGILSQGKMIEQITAAELEQKCTDYLLLRAAKPQKAAALLEQRFRLRRWEMRPEGEIRIYDTVDARAVGEALAQAGIAVEELGLHRQDLEGYFLEKMGGAEHV